MEFTPTQLRVFFRHIYLRFTLLSNGHKGGTPPAAIACLHNLVFPVYGVRAMLLLYSI